ncbi:MAG: class I SAM-dependent methyltransferase [Gemmatimonadales bacterium]
MTGPAQRVEADRWLDLPAPAEFSEAPRPAIETTDVPHCPVCESADFRPLTVGFDYEILTCTNPWRFVECEHCHHVWLNPRPATFALPTIYPSTYYAYDTAARINPIALKGKAMLDRFKLGGIFRAFGRAPTSFLDIGCGSGQYLRVAERRGIDRSQIYGLELNDEVVAGLSGQGYQVFNERVETCESIPDGSIDLATMFHVIEHVDDPLAVARRVHAWLRPGGVFAVETPNIDSLDARLFRDRYWGGYHIPRHWNLFRPDTLHRLFQQTGFEVVSTAYQTGHSFWMYSFHHRLRYGIPPRHRLSQWFNPFRGLPMLVMFTAFDKLRAALGFRTSAMLVLARKPE